MKTKVTPEELREIENELGRSWAGRVLAQDYQYGLARYRKAELEFYAGATAALQAVLHGYTVPPKLFFNVMRGEAYLSKKELLAFIEAHKKAQA